MLVVTLASAQQNWGKWKQGQNLNWQDMCEHTPILTGQRIKT